MRMAKAKLMRIIQEPMGRQITQGHYHAMPRPVVWSEAGLNPMGIHQWCDSRGAGHVSELGDYAGQREAGGAWVRTLSSTLMPGRTIFYRNRLAGQPWTILRKHWDLWIRPYYKDLDNENSAQTIGRSECGKNHAGPKPVRGETVLNTNQKTHYINYYDLYYRHSRRVRPDLELGRALITEIHLKQMW